MRFMKAPLTEVLRILVYCCNLVNCYSEFKSVAVPHGQFVALLV